MLIQLANGNENYRNIKAEWQIHALAREMLSTQRNRRWELLCCLIYKWSFSGIPQAISRRNRVVQVLASNAVETREWLMFEQTLAELEIIPSCQMDGNLPQSGYSTANNCSTGFGPAWFKWTRSVEMLCALCSHICHCLSSRVNISNGETTGTEEMLRLGVVVTGLSGQIRVPVRLHWSLLMNYCIYSLICFECQWMGDLGMDEGGDRASVCLSW